jgi:hypothetical protein
LTSVSEPLFYAPEILGVSDVPSKRFVDRKERRMKGKLMLGVLVSVGILAAPAFAQNVTDMVQLTRSAIQTDRKAIVTNALAMTEEESQAFWPVYNEYWLEMNKVLDKRVNLIMDYAKNYGAVTDEKAGQLLDDFIKVQEERLKLKKKFVKKFRKVLPDTKVARYYQVENKLDALIDLDIAAEIPLVR